MDGAQQEMPALLVIDMVKDNFKEARHLPITPLAQKIIDPINRLAENFRARGWPVVYSTDAFHEGDFIFTGRMKPHSLAGTEGADVIEDLERRPEDLWLPKPRFSAFWGTDLKHWLKNRNVTLCAVAGIATNYCVLTTALDAICADFKAVLLEDCATAVSEEIHHQTLNLYRRGALYPLLKVATSNEMLNDLAV